MNNPKVYFSINRNFAILIPIRTQNKDLDTAFADTEVCKANHAAYNDYTKNFIKDNVKSGEIFYSENYTFNPDTKVFNFNELVVCTDEDYEDMGNNPCTFDIYTEYKFVDNNIRIDTINNTNNLLATIRDNYPCPTIDSGFYVEEKTWYFLVRNIIKHANTMLIGPTGTGKTEIIQRICKEMNIDCHVYDMGSMQDPLTDLLGSHRLENGSSIFDYAKFVEDVQKPGVILLDELSRAPLMTNNILFPCLDNRRTLPVEIADSKHDRTVKVHPKCTFIATANIGSEYVGTNDIDAALLNRFLPIQLDYLPEDIEVNVVNIRTGLSKAIAKKMINFINKVRGEYAAGNISKSVSTRESIACAELVVDGFSLIDSINFIITNKYMNNNYNDELTFIKKMIMGF